tara:strand:- start:1475 stop:2086 length:612 start_codon:yes stop_codon:yes gene_type:complete
MFIKLLSDVIIWVYDRIKYVVSKPDYKIIDQSMEYTIDNNIIPEELSDFWEDEYDEWDGETETFYKNLNGIDYNQSVVPNNVTHIILRIKYWYNDKMYKYLVNDLDHKWPPENISGVIFNIPIVTAVLLDSDDKPVKDLLNKIKRYAGPRCNFHGQKVKISDMLYYDDETLELEYPSIKIKNAIGMVKKVSTVDGYITDLRIP